MLQVSDSPGLVQDQPGVLLNPGPPPAPDHGEEKLLALFREIVRDHTVRTPEDHAICKHFATRGTVSSSLILVPAPPRETGRFLYCDGPPCRNEFRDVSALWPT